MEKQIVRGSHRVILTVSSSRISEDTLESYAEFYPIFWIGRKQDWKQQCSEWCLSTAVWEPFHHCPPPSSSCTTYETPTNTAGRGDTEPLNYSFLAWWILVCLALSIWQHHFHICSQNSQMPYSGMTMNCRIVAGITFLLSSLRYHICWSAVLQYNLWFYELLKSLFLLFFFKC